ncbi:hypothetical protein ACFS5N_17750 [Mucilaginibacter ximonensis]|uniref:SGNH/GDSL hydrolase family protein n=1 Tax=Mucilaginibacter ximonensis TaxID=538021 RepID=A0ABW5YGA7_9SPHI
MIKKYCLLFVAWMPLIMSCKKQNNTVSQSTLTFSNVVILGNSITYAPHDNSIGWYGDWGMAATALDLDYAHLLLAKFKVKNPNVQVQIKNIAAFEKDAVNYDLDANLKELKNSKPDLLILRIGENVPAGTDMTVFDERYTALINYFKSANPNIIILSAGSVWADNIDAVMMKHPPYVLLSSMIKTGSNFSFGLWSNPGVELHPSNKGMENIALALWNKISSFTANDRK